MKFREVFRFEFAYGIRRLQTWLIFAAVSTIAYLLTRGNFLEDATKQDFYLNAPFVVAFVTAMSCLFWLLVGATIAGDAAARDVATGMHPLTYTTPVRKDEYLGARFLAALALNALLMLAVPVGILISVHAPGVEARLVGPFRPAAYLTAYGLLSLPSAFIGTAIQFAWAALGRRPIAGYVGSLILFAVAYGGMFTVGFFLEQESLSPLFDAFGQVHIVSETTALWTPFEKNTRLIRLEGTLLYSRFIWLGVALSALAFTYARFRFAHPTLSPFWSRLTRRQLAHAPMSVGRDVVSAPISVPQVRQSFGLETYARQTCLLAWTSFRTIAIGRGGLVAAPVIAGFVVLFVSQSMYDMDTPLVPRSVHVLTFLRASLTDPMTPWVVIPLLIVLYAGELVWRERDAGLGEITDAAPIPDWIRFLGKFLGLSLFLIVLMAFLTLGGIGAQVWLGYYTFEVGLYGRILFGLQLPEYLLFAVLALVVQGLVGQKYAGHLVTLVVYSCVVFASMLLGINHDLLVYGAGPAWTYSDMRGFGTSLGPWAWFKFYWAAWALGLAVVARLLWVRGMEGGLRARLRMARGRFTRPTAWTAAVAGVLILMLCGFLFYNTNVVNEYVTDSEQTARSAEYERRYKRYENLPQPRVTATRLHIELYPERRAAEIRGTYRLVNFGPIPIDSIHVAPVRGVETGAVTFDRAAVRVLADDDLGHRIYALRQPLRPGDALRLSFAVRVEPRGIRAGDLAAVMPNGTYFTSEYWLPAIGYQPSRELVSAKDRRAQRLAPRPLVPSLYDLGPRQSGRERTNFEAVMGTSAGQVAVAPGTLRRTWTRNGRRYFHYASDAPIGTEQAFFSANYALREARWNPSAGSGQAVLIQLYHDPRHGANVDRLLRSAQASLNHYSRQYGPYPYRHLRLIENPVRGMGAHADASSIDYGQGFSLYNPEQDRRGLDFPFAVMAHEVAHQWWGVQLPAAPVEGIGLLTESPAWYSALGVVEETYGREHMRRLLRFFRKPHIIPPIRQAMPLLRGADPYAGYRKGPFALYGLSEYVGKDRVDLAYRRMIERYGSGASPLPTSLDLYRELRAVTPDSLRTLLHDLFAANTVWELETERATAKQTAAGAWRITLHLKARKVVVSPTGVETEVPMNDWVEIGAFAPTGEGAEFGETLYLRKHRIRSGQQILTVTVPRQPSDAGIDPYHLLYELERFDNVEEVKVER